MSKIFDFKKRFGKTIDPAEVRRDFVNKIKNFLVDPIDRLVGWYYGDEGGAIYRGENREGTKLFNYAAMEFNQDPAKIIDAYNRNDLDVYTTRRPSFNEFTGEDFEKTLLLVEVFYDYFSQHNIYGYSCEQIDKVVRRALAQPISLGISWRGGKFYPEGVEEFDEKLIEDVLKWLQDNPKISVLYKNALDLYSQSINDSVKRKDVICNAFQAVEQLTQKYLKSPKPSFDNNFNSLVDKLVNDKEWKKIFNSYRELSKEFGRHAGKGNNFIPNQEDTEAFLYLSGLIMRLILQKIKHV